MLSIEKAKEKNNHILIHPSNRWRFEFLLIQIIASWMKKHIRNRTVTAALYKKGVSKSRPWRSLESSVGVLRLRKCNKIGYFHRKKVHTSSNSDTRSAITKFLSISSQKQWKKLKVLHFSYDPIRTIWS
jgi:hypothetical protein